MWSYQIDTLYGSPGKHHNSETERFRIDLRLFCRQLLLFGEPGSWAPCLQLHLIALNRIQAEHLVRPIHYAFGIMYFQQQSLGLEVLFSGIAIAIYMTWIWIPMTIYNNNNKL